MPFPNTATQFQPGQSGNPGGYSKNRRVIDSLVELIGEKNATKALATVWLQRALKGDHRFFCELLNRYDGPVNFGSDAEPAPVPIDPATADRMLKAALDPVPSEMNEPDAVA